MIEYSALLLCAPKGECARHNLLQINCVTWLLGHLCANTWIVLWFGPLHNLWAAVDLLTASMAELRQSLNELSQGQRIQHAFDFPDRFVSHCATKRDSARKSEKFFRNGVHHKYELPPGQLYSRWAKYDRWLFASRLVVLVCPCLNCNG